MNTLNDYIKIFELENKEELLKNSLFYYCCGKDPSPIIAFKDQFPLYVYVDKKDFSSELFDILQKEHLTFIKKEIINNSINSILTKWKYKDNTFFLLYIQYDACKTYKILYGDFFPKCICNYRYELPNRYILEVAEKNVKYILGHCFNKDYVVDKYYDYYGDYSFNQKVKIPFYKKKYL